MTNYSQLSGASGVLGGSAVRDTLGIAVRDDEHQLPRPTAEVLSNHTKDQSREAPRAKVLQRQVCATSLE